LTARRASRDLVLQKSLR